ncbi:hypothetical protein ACS0TY_019824 [Phlomoides rotata]
MADSTAVVPFQIPTDPSSSFFDDPTLDLSEPILNDETYPPFNLDNNEWDHLFDSEDPLSDPVLWELCHGSDDVPGNSRVEEGCSSNGMNDNCTQYPAFGDQSMPISVQPYQYNCVCCHILREITHTNGVHFKRLEIHGAFGVITHAVLGIFDFYTSMQTHDFQMFDFQKESTEMVKKFLVQYFEACKQEGYTPMQDPLSTFYEALSVGLNQLETMDGFPQLPPLNTGDYRYNQHETLNQPESGSNEGGSIKIPLSMQRERTRKLKLRDFRDYFSLPIGEAAQKLNLCPTVVKKICRKHGVSRWPYRKIKSIERKLSNSVRILDASVGEERRQILEDIQKYKQELANIYEPFTN